MVEEQHAPARDALVRDGAKMREMAYPERFELPTSWSVAKRSIQLSYGYAVEEGRV